MHKITQFLVDFFVGLLARSFQMALLSAVLSVPAVLLLGSQLSLSYLDFFRMFSLSGIGLYLIIYMIRLLYESWRKEL